MGRSLATLALRFGRSWKHLGRVGAKPGPRMGREARDARDALSPRGMRSLGRRGRLPRGHNIGSSSAGGFSGWPHCSVLEASRAEQGVRDFATPRVTCFPGSASSFVDSGAGILELESLSHANVRSGYCGPWPGGERCSREELSELLVKQECSWWAVGLGWGSDRPLCALARSEQLMQLYSARQRRRLNRGLRRKQHSLLKRLRKAKKDAPPMEKPEVVKTHLRDMIILPEMVGSMVGVYNGKTFNQVEIKVRVG